MWRSPETVTTRSFLFAFAFFMLFSDTDHAFCQFLFFPNTKSFQESGLGRAIPRPSSIRLFPFEASVCASSQHLVDAAVLSKLSIKLGQTFTDVYAELGMVGGDVKDGPPPT